MPICHSRVPCLPCEWVDPSVCLQVYPPMEGLASFVAVDGVYLKTRNAGPKALLTA